MARSCGLRIGPRHFELVVLEGSAKKPKITAYETGELPREGDDPLAAASTALKEAIKKHSIPKDNVGVAIDTGLAAFRTLKVPFSDKAKIEQVLKFEVESLLPQWDIDDVIVDFQVLETTADGSEILITAVRKQDLKRVLTVCEKAGLEPLEAELETTAMVNAALSAGMCTTDNAQILVHIGETSTSVVVMDGGKVREMRAIHIGALTHEMQIPPATEGESAASEPVEAAGPAGPAGTAAPGATADPATGTWLDTVPDADERQRRLDQTIRRIRRELGRTVSATRTLHPIQDIYVCGLEVPDLVGSSIIDVKVHALDTFERDAGQPSTGFGQLVVPFGVALRQLGGGVLRPSLRREELRYTGAFERVELPLAVVSLLLVTLLGVWNIFLYKESTYVDSHLKYWRDNAVRFLIGAPAKGQPGYLSYPSEEITKKIANLDSEADVSKYQQLKDIKVILDKDIRKLEKDLGQDADISQPQSALRGMMLVLDVLDKQATDGRPSLRKVRSSYEIGRSGKPDSVHVAFDITFFAENSTLATQNYEAFVHDLQSQPWYVSVDGKSNVSLENGKGIYIQNLSFVVDVRKAMAAKGAQ